MRRLIPAVLLLVAIIGISGCGGAGGGDALTIPLQSTNRQLLPGDQLEYTATGTANNGQSSFPVTGSGTYTISSSTVQIPGGPVANKALVNITLHVNGQTRVSATQDYFTQDAGGAVSSWGGVNENGAYFLASPAIGYYIETPSPMSQGTSWSAHVVQTDGLVYDVSFVVTGIETVTVPAGRFETYRVTGSGIYMGLPCTITVWYAPQIGGFVREHLMMTDTVNAITFDITVELASRNRRP